MFNKGTCPFLHDPASKGRMEVCKNLYLQRRLQQINRVKECVRTCIFKGDYNKLKGLKVEMKFRAEKSFTKRNNTHGACHVNTK